MIVKATGKDTNSRKTATVTLDPEMSIREVKQRITGVMRLPDMGSSEDPDIRIILAGRELDDRVTVGECDLGNQVSLNSLIANFARLLFARNCRFRIYQCVATESIPC